MMRQEGANINMLRLHTYIKIDVIKMMKIMGSKYHIINFSINNFRFFFYK